jgi:arginine-tRNA-protein transferase
MRERFAYIEPPRVCSYLPEERASLETRLVSEMSSEEYAALLARGYRRFGYQVFRPACPQCRQCRSVRIPVRRFDPSAGERRVLRKNAGVRAELHRLFVTREHVDLYNRYHRFMREEKGWPRQQTTPESYHAEYLSGAAERGRQWLYFDRSELVGVALMDEAPGAISLVYCFYDPAWRPRSPGTYSILNQLLYAKANNLEYAYLGYWIERCPSMSYKGRFHPREILREYPAAGQTPVWE